MNRATAMTGRLTERTRLEDRTSRTSVVLTLLDGRRDDRRSDGDAVPAALSDTIGGFEAELQALDARLDDLRPSAH
jgi:hypothetical protein